MSRSEVEEAVANANSGSAWIRISCPWCGDGNPAKRNMSVSHETTYYFCHKCEERGFYRPTKPSLDTFAAPKTEAVTAVEEPEKPALPWYYKPLSLRPKMLEDEHFWNYVVNRGVHPETIVDFGVGYCVGGFYANSVIIPIWNQGELAGFAAKNLTDGQYRYPKGFRREDVMLNMDRLRDPDPTVVVEGSFDVLPYAPHTVGTLGKPTKNHIKLMIDSANYVKETFSTSKRFYLMLDGDARAENWAAVRHLRKNGVDVVEVRTPSGMDPNEIATEDELLFYNLLNEAVK